MLVHELWIQYAENDLTTAHLAYKNNYILSSAFFLTQQCAEKSLKAFLVAQNKPLRRIHDLSELVKDCMRVEMEFVAVRLEARSLNPFVTLYRYPDIARPLPNKLLLEECLQHATVVLNFVKHQMGKPIKEAQ